MKLIRSLFSVCMIGLVTVAVSACGPPPPPDPPTNITTNANWNIDGKIEFTFELKEEFKDRVQTIKVYRDVKQDGDFSDVLKEFKLTDGELDEENRVYKFKLVDTNVLPGSQYDVPYFYKFSSVSPEGKEGPKSEVQKAESTNANPPEEVKDIKVESNNVEDGPQIVITWTANTEFDIKGYYIFRAEDDKPIKVSNPDEAVSKLVPHKEGATLSWVDTNVTEGKPYWYIVVGVDKGDEIGKRSLTARYPATVLGKAQQVSPEDGATVAKPTFSWEPVESARGYMVVLQRSTTGNVVWRSDFIEGKTEVTYPSSADPLTSNLRYYWYVYTFLEKPQDLATAVGNSRSDLRSFKVQ